MAAGQPSSHDFYFVAKENVVMYFQLISRSFACSPKISIKKMFFTLEGSEGVGKSTLIESLKIF